MDDMTAFERQVAGRLQHHAGPISPVDDLAVYESITAASRSHRRGFTMFSALKFVAAAVIVALFGGFLLAGVLTTRQADEMAPAAVSASPTIEATSEPTETDPTSVRTDILPGVELTVEEVEPGLFHVIDDGVRDLHSGRQTDIATGHDDGIWLLRKNQFFRLGSEAEQAWPTESGPYHADFEVTPDGTVWVRQTGKNPFVSGTLFSLDSDDWTRTQSPPGTVLATEVAPDGTLWALYGDDGPAFGYLGPDGWQALDAELWEGASLTLRLHPTDSGVLYVDECAFGGCIARRYVDGAWHELPDGSGGFAAFDVAPDGAVWSLDAANRRIRRLAGDAWVSWTPEDLPHMGLGIALDGDASYGGPSLTSTFVAAPDGSMWASLWQRGPDGDKPPAGGLWTIRQGDPSRYDPQCDGLIRFDGETADRFLPGRCISMDIAADGSVWVLADEEKGKDLYVITPEAQAASGVELGQQKEG